MNTDMAERRQRNALTLWLIAGLLAAVAAVTVGIETRSLRQSGDLPELLPEIAESIEEAQRISIVAPNGEWGAAGAAAPSVSYTIERTPRGWVMRERDNYPVSADRLGQLTGWLRALELVRNTTSDPAKHERLSVLDPRAPRAPGDGIDGMGVLVQIEDSRGARLVNHIFGIALGGNVYARSPDDDQTVQARAPEGTPQPPFQQPGQWLELQALAMPADRLARIEIMPAQGRAYVLARDSADMPWRIAAPALAALSQSSVTRTAEQITQLAPVDVRTAPAVQGQPFARLRAATFDGVLVDAELIAQDGESWLKLVARAQAPEQEPSALEINDNSASWAYQLSEEQARSLVPPLSDLVPSD